MIINGLQNAIRQKSISLIRTKPLPLFAMCFGSSLKKSLRFHLKKSPRFKLMKRSTYAERDCGLQLIMKTEILFWTFLSSDITFLLGMVNYILISNSWKFWFKIDFFLFWKPLLDFNSYAMRFCTKFSGIPSPFLN